MKPIKYSPVHDVALELGLATADVVGWLIGNHYTNRPVDPGSLSLFDESGHGKIMIHGRAGAQVVAALNLEAPAQIGRGQVAGDVAVYRLRADQLFVSTAPGQETTACTAMATTKTDERVTITDVTHGRAQLRLVGAASAELLSRLCGLDLSPRHIPNHSAHQTSVAKTTQLVIRSDMPGGELSYVLIGARSLGEYLWRSLLAAGEDLGIQV